MSDANFSSAPAILLPLIWGLVGLIFAGPLWIASRWLAGRNIADERLTAVVPFVGLGLLGYASFFTYLVSPLGGRVLAMTIIAGSWCAIVFRRSPRAGALTELWLPGKLMLGLGLLYLAVLYLPQSTDAFDAQPANRFITSLPSDTILPEILGNIVYQGKAIRPFVGDWTSSDRPPLQTGLYLLVLPWLRLLHLPVSLGYQCTGTLLQLAWVPAVWLFSRRLGASHAKSFAVVLVLATTGFFLINATFVWPKLLSAGYTIAAAILLLEPDPTRPRCSALVGSAAAALAFLAHGSAGFALLALGLVWAATYPHPPWRNVMPMGLMFAGLLAPWMFYQVVLDPPGNRLLKWHLAGVISLDGRDFLDALHDAYRQLTVRDWVQGRWANIQAFFADPIPSPFELSQGKAPVRRAAEFYHGVRALGFLNAAWVIAAIFNRKPSATGLVFHNPKLVYSTVVWTGLTWGLWILLMFIPGSTLNHQGPYSLWLVAFSFATLLLLQAPVWIVLPLLCCHGANFIVTWVLIDATATMQPAMVAALFAAGLALGAVGFRLKVGEKEHWLTERSNNPKRTKRAPDAPAP